MLARWLLALRTSFAALLARAWRRSPSLPAPPAPGVYRARPDLPVPPPDPPPPPPKPKPPDPRRKPLVHALGSSLLAAAGLFGVISARRIEQRFSGVLALVLFGTAAWVFWEQVAAGGETAPLAPRAHRRTLVVAGLNGIVALATAVAFEGMSPIHRLLVAVLGLLLIFPGLAAMWQAARAIRASRTAQLSPRRRSSVDERRPPILSAPRTMHVNPPPPTPDLRVQRRRWRRRG